VTGGAVIIGAGECGARAAFALREEGFDGAVTLLGAERHLPYERPPLSKDGMLAESAGMKTVAEAERFEAAGIALRLGTEVLSIDRAAKTISIGDGSALPYGTLLLATGARPRRLPLAEGSRHCLYLRTHDDAQAIAARLKPGARIVVVGGGFIGLELAAAARRRDCAVTVIEALPRLLARAVPEEIASVMETAHRAHGVDIRCRAAIEAIEDTETGVEIALAGGSTIAADLVIIGIGATPNTELAEQTGLAIDNGIRVDDKLRTDDPSIFAAGDCCSFPLAIYAGRRVRLEAWRNAQDQGTLAARNMLGRDETHVAVPWFWSDQYEMTLQIAGLADEGARVVRRDLGGGALLLFHLAEDGRLVAASGIGPGNAVARDVRLAEMLIARRATPSVDSLADPGAKLKSLLAA
jgi:3-phenylpropionate/trans-cinnamate dioxygenase ferredoxin reductase subunit